MTDHNDEFQEPLRRRDDMPKVLEAISKKLDAVLDRLAVGDTALALLNHRVAFLEKIVYGLCGTFLLGVIGAIAALIFKTHP